MILVSLIEFPGLRGSVRDSIGGVFECGHCLLHLWIKKVYSIFLHSSVSSPSKHQSTTRDGCHVRAISSSRIVSTICLQCAWCNTCCMIGDPILYAVYPSFVVIVKSIPYSTSVWMYCFTWFSDKFFPYVNAWSAVYPFLHVWFGSAPARNSCFVMACRSSGWFHVAASISGVYPVICIGVSGSAPSLTNKCAASILRDIDINSGVLSDSEYIYIPCPLSMSLSTSLLTGVRGEVYINLSIDVYLVTVRAWISAP